MKFSKEELERALIEWAAMDMELYDAVGDWDWNIAAFVVCQAEDPNADWPTTRHYAIAMVEFLLGGQRGGDNES